MKDRAKLWNAVEIAEKRKDAQLAREVQLSLPHELDEDQNRSMVLEFVQARFVDRGMIADVAIHAPDREGDQRNVHAHVMLTLRDLTSDGFGKKNRDWNTPEQLQEWRKSWAEHQNKAFKELGLEQRVDHRSYEDQGIDQEPTQHLGQVANDMERKGKASRIGDENRERQARNADRAGKALEAAKTTRQLAQQKTIHDELAATRAAALQTHLQQDEIDLGRKHSRQSANLDADLVKRNGDWRQQLENERRQLERELQADGWRKLMRDLLGKTRKDQEQLQATHLNLEHVNMREAEERQTLQARQTAEREAQQHEAQRRSDAHTLRQEEHRTAALEAVREAERPISVQSPSNDQQRPPRGLIAAPEQDNSATVMRQDFAQSAKEKARAEVLERARAAFTKSNDRDGGRDFE